MRVRPSSDSRAHALSSHTLECQSLPLEQGALLQIAHFRLSASPGRRPAAAVRSKWPASPALPGAAQAGDAAATLLPAVVMSGSPQQQRGPASAPFVQAEAPSERLIDTLSKLDVAHDDADMVVMYLAYIV